MFIFVVNGRVNTNYGEFASQHVAQNDYTCRGNVGGGGDILYTYRLTSQMNYRISSASAKLTKENLDKGLPVGDTAKLYAQKLNHHVGNFYPGMILNTKFGGDGTDPVNLFPQSSIIYNDLYQSFENRVYNCLKRSDDSSSALLRWEFNYVDVYDTRPHAIYYTVTFDGNSKCRSVSMSFAN